MVFVLVLAAAVTLALEMLGRHSVLDGMAFVFVHPVYFTANVMIVLVTLTVGLFFKKRAFFLALGVSFWLLLGLTDAVVLCFRNTPFGFVDVMLLPSVASIIDVYMDPWQIVLLGLVIVTVIAGLVRAFVRAEKHAPNYRLAAIFFAAALAAAAGFYGLTVAGHKQVRNRQETFANIIQAYDQYGFVYCFTTGAFDQGVDEPSFYTRAAVNWLVGNLEEVPAPAVRSPRCWCFTATICPTSVSVRSSWKMGISSGVRYA